MSWNTGGWQKADDGSAMKVSDSNGVLKTETITDTKPPHDHDIVKVDRPSGRVQETSVGKNKQRGK